MKTSSRYWRYPLLLVRLDMAAAIAIAAMLFLWMMWR